MINLIIGKKGAGKTKRLVELSNSLTDKTDGNIVVIVDDNRITFDLNHKSRLINIKNYEISNLCGLYGFICGICAGNYDVTNILIDSILCNDKFSDKELASFIEKLNSICEKNNTNLTLALSLEETDLPREILSLVEIKK